MKKIIRLTEAELQSNLNRVKLAELLISQLPETHDGRNSWLLNYGTGPEAKGKRKARGIKFINKLQAAETRGGK